MPRVNTKTKSTAGKTLTCGRCREEIKPGEKYRSWSFFRSRSMQVRCFRATCNPRRSELTQSLMGEVYAAIESAEEAIGQEGATVADMIAAVEEVADVASDVATQYRDAAEPFGGAGENADRADELEGWQSDLECYQPEEEPEDDDDVDDDDDDDPEAEVTRVREEARDAAQELLDGCPL